MSRITRDFLAISAADVECERVFNTAKALYDHRKTYNSIIFFAYMMMRFHDQKKNLQTKLDVDLSIEEKMSHEDLDKKMKKRVNELQHVYNERYISDDEDEDDSSSKTNVSRSIKIRRHNLILH
jgi:high-affinity K+ transport system ATPase subunit B